MLVPSSTASLHRHGCRSNPKREKERNKESTATANNSSQQQRRNNDGA
jgi:hypothetical protein